jgi:hypothetical protein
MFPLMLIPERSNRAESALQRSDPAEFPIFSKE